MSQSDAGERGSSVSVSVKPQQPPLPSFVLNTYANLCQYIC